MFSNNYRLKRRKQFQLYEVGKDMEYIKRFKRGPLDFKEDDSRKKMASLKRKGEDKTDLEEKEIEILEDLITESRAVKAEYEKLEGLYGELENYLSLL